MDDPLNSNLSLPGAATATRRNGILLVLSSPSGAGKSTLSRRLLASDDGFMLSVSVTTRPPRQGEIEGKDYFFVSNRRFNEMVTEGDLLEHAQVFGNAYGTPREPVEAAVGAGRDVLFDVDWQGAQQIRLSMLGSAMVSIFLLPPSIAALESRLKSRAQDSEDVIAGRMAKAKSEISHWAEYDYVLINDDLDRCFSQIETILAAERLRLARLPGMRWQIEMLDREFEAR